MNTSNHIQADYANIYLSRLQEYKDTVVRLFPTLTQRTLDSLSISPADALFLGYFLDDYPQKVTILERGVSLGTSTFFLANHQKVSRVFGIDSNPSLTQDVPSGYSDRNGSDAGEASGILKVLDVAHAAFAEYAVARQKISLHESAENPAVTAAPELSEERNTTATWMGDSSAGGGVIALINESQSRRAVSSELKAIFARYPHAIAFVGSCRQSRGPFVQAGVVDFLEELQGSYHFQLVSDLELGLASSTLGIIYPDQVAMKMEEVLAEISGRFSKKLDPLRLLQQNEELVESMGRAQREPNQAPRSNNELRKQNEELNNRVSALTQRNAHLENHYSSRRYKLADAAIDKVQRINSLKRFIR